MNRAQLQASNCLMANPIELHGDPAAKNKKEQSGQLPVAAPGNGSWVFRPKKKKLP
jgi:hypothetical protein